MTDVATLVQARAIDHVGVAVADLDTAIGFYTSTFGLHVTHTETNAGQGVREAMLSGPDGEVSVQLLAPLTADSAIARFLETSGPGLQQLALRVDDVVAAASALRAAGLRVLYDEPRPGTAGSSINFVHPRDCSGVLVELVQPADRSGGASRAADH